MVDEDTFDKIKEYETNSDLTAKQKTTLKLADVYMMRGRVDDELRAEVFEHFTPAQAVALTLKSVNYTSQKMLVALEADVEYEAAEKTEAGFNKMDYEHYIDALAGDSVNLPPAESAKH